MLPKFLMPFYVRNKELIRVGSKFDGGYVVLIKSIVNTKHLITYGISDNFDFEKEFQKKSNCTLVSYDDSTNLKFWFLRLIKDLIKLLQLKIFKYDKIINIFKFIDFYFFYKKKNNNFYLKKISNKKNCLPFHKTINPKINNFFLKIDIEGYEYEFFNQILKFEDKMTGFVIEFHQIEKHYYKIKKFINKLKHQKLIHIHGCTYSKINKKKIPDIMELSFANKIYLNNTKTKKYKKYPVKVLDNPNSKRHTQFILN